MYEAVRRLPIHREIVAFILAVDEILAALPRERWYLRDQIRRAALSILLNLREGAAELRGLEKARFYRIARRSTAEVAAGLEMLGLFMPGRMPRIIELDPIASRITLDLHKLATEWARRGRAAKERHTGTPMQRPPQP